MNLELLNAKIEAKGIRKEKVAAELGISLAGLRLKLIGESEFKISEAVKLTKLLEMTPEEAGTFLFT